MDKIIYYFACYLLFFLHLHPSIIIAKGRTNVELREQFILANGVSQGIFIIL